MRNALAAAVFGLFAFSFPALAQAPVSTNPAKATQDKPVEISASQTLEWLRAEKKYVARGDAEIKQGDFLLKSRLIEALYRDGAQGKSEIYQITATDNVQIHLPPHIAYGDRAVYTVDNAQAVLTGQNLRIVTPEETITARDRIVYDQARAQLSAQGAAHVTKGDNTLDAQTLTAIFVPGAEGSQTLDRIVAQGDVVITSLKEKITGASGVYTAATQKAVLEGPVRLESPEGYLEGARAEVDMATGISRIFADSTGGEGQPGRVTGRFYPKKSEEKPQ